MEETSPAVRDDYVASPFGPTAVGKTDAVALDREALKLLASDTRLDILKTLRARRMTVSELSSTLALGKSTVFEHLNKLVDGGLVVRHDDPSREWVYYELAPKSKRLFSPVSAKIVLMLSTVVALGLAALVVFSLYGVAGPGLHVETDGETLLAGEATPVGLRVVTSGGDPVTGAGLTLVSADAYAVFRDGAPLDGRPLAAEIVDGVATVRVALPAGDHHIVAETADGQLASRDGSGLVRVTPAVLHVDPSPLLVGADQGRPIRFWLTHGDRVLDDGSLLVEGPSASFVGRRTADLDDAIETARLELTAPGVAEFSYRPAGEGSYYAAVAEGVPVEMPTVSVAPEFLVAGQEASLTVTVWHDTRGSIAEAPVRVRLDSGAAPGRVETDPHGVARITLSPDEVGEARVYVGDTLFASVPVVKLLNVQTAVTSLGLEMWVQDLETGYPVHEAFVEVDGARIADADGAGHALVTEPGAVIVRAEGYAPYGIDVPGWPAATVHWVSKDVPRTDGSSASVAVTELDVSAPAKVPAGGVLHVTAVMRNPSSRAVVETAVLVVDGARWSAQDVPLAPGESRTIEFPVVLRDVGIHRVSVNDATVLEVEVEAARAPVTVQAASTPVPWALTAVALLGAAFVVARRRR